MRTRFNLSALCVSSILLLASCGGSPAPKPNPTPGNNGGGNTPVTGGTIARPEGSTAANEFIITGVRAAALAQALGVDMGQAQNVMARKSTLQAQATTDEMRVLLAVTRAKTGDNAGKKRAVATFVWGNDQEKIVPLDADTKSVILDIYPQSAPALYQRYQGDLNMAVTYPDFQAKTTRNGVYMNDSGPMCAKLSFNFKSAAMADPAPAGYTPLVFNNTASPLEVCEGVTERNAEKVALEKAADGLMYDYQSLGASPFTFTSKDNLTALPTNAATLAAAVGTSAIATVTLSTLADFFAPLTVLPAGDSTTWTPEQKANAARARKYASLQKQFGYYYRATQVYTVQGAGRDEIYLLGLNGWGVGGLKVLRFK